MTKLRPILIIMLLCLTLVMSGYGMDIGLGAATQWASHNYDALLILPQSYPPRQNLAILIETNHDNFAFQIGRVMGSTAAMLQGITEIVDGIQRVQVGVLVSAETGGIGGAVAVSGVVESVHGAAVAVHGVRGLVESTGHILKMTAKGGGGGKNYTFFTDEEVAKRLGVTKKVYEREVKRQIKKESEMFMRKIDTKNPDIGIDNDTGYIVLKHPDNGQTIATDLLFK